MITKGQSLNSLLIFIIGVLIMNGCGSSKNSIKPPREPISIPLKVCSELIITDYEYLYDNLRNTENLGFSFVYSMVYSKLDSLQELKIRRKSESIAKDVVKYVFPDIIVLNDTTKIDREYNYMLHHMYRMFNPRQPERKTSKIYFEALKTQSDVNKQLFLRINTDIEKKTSIYVYIIDAQNNKTLYFDLLTYYCDLRDDESLIKSLNYILLRIKENSE